MDNTIGGGTAEFHAAMENVCCHLKVGSREQSNFYYKGLRVKTIWVLGIENSWTFYVTLEGDEYLEAAMTVNVPKGYPSQRLNPADTTNFRSVAGCIGYCSNSFRPDLSLECSMLGCLFFEPTIANAILAKAVLDWAKENRNALTFKRGFAQALTVLCDSAGPDEYGTQGGRLVALTDNEGHRIGGFSFWELRKVKRVYSATIPGETLSTGEGHETAMRMQQMRFELAGIWIPVRLVVDIEGLNKNSGNTKLPIQKRLELTWLF